MTIPLDDGRPPITAPGIHDRPPERPKAPFTQKQLRAIGNALTDQILARVLLAVAGIQVPLLGKPFAFLAQWAQALQQRANDAYAGAMGAQSAANYANAQLVALAGGGLASEVTGGVTINEFFDGPSSNDLGPNFIRRSDGPGSGAFGLNGAGQAIWKRSGGNSRNHWDTHLTPLATRYQVVMVLMQAKPQTFYLQVTGLHAHTMLRVRVSATDDTTFVFASIYPTSVVVGCSVAGVETVLTSDDGLTSTPVEWADGDVVHFLAGTNADDREFIVKRNGVIVWRGTDDAALSQVDDTEFLRVGIRSRAADRGSGIIFNASQTVPAQLEVFSAADRLKTSV